MKNLNQSSIFNEDMLPSASGAMDVGSVSYAVNSVYADFINETSSSFTAPGIKTTGNVAVELGAGGTVWVFKITEADNGVKFNYGESCEELVAFGTSVNKRYTTGDSWQAGGISATLKSGTDQGDAGAAAGELWVDTNDDNTVKMGV